MVAESVRCCIRTWSSILCVYGCVLLCVCENQITCVLGEHTTGKCAACGMRRTLNVLCPRKARAFFVFRWLLCGSAEGSTTLEAHSRATRRTPPGPRSVRLGWVWTLTESVYMLCMAKYIHVRRIHRLMLIHIIHNTRARWARVLSAGTLCEVAGASPSCARLVLCVGK